MTVSVSPFFSPSRSPWIRAWCAQVTVVPEQSRISVLSNGSSTAFITSMPFEGNIPSIGANWLGTSEQSQQDQNQPTTNMTSDATHGNAQCGERACQHLLIT